MSTIRILDAAFNRASEGMRVVEDYARFALDDTLLTTEAKSLRHALATAKFSLGANFGFSSRETEADVGTTISTPEEVARKDAADVCTASFKRVEQALRSIAEYGKLLDPGLAHSVEQIRYRTYTLERCIGIHRVSLERLSDARLCVLVDCQNQIGEFSELVISLVGAGVDMIQLRDSHRTDRELIDRARHLVAATRGSNTIAIINDRPDIAAIALADGVQVGQSDLKVKDVRGVVGPNALIGVSTHSVKQVKSAVLAGANYLGVGPVFPSTTKNFDEFPGLPFIREVASEIQLPWFAIGGITINNIQTVTDSGANRVAIQAAVCDAASPAEAAKDLRAVIVSPSSKQHP